MLLIQSVTFIIDEKNKLGGENNLPQLQLFMHFDFNFFNFNLLSPRVTGITQSIDLNIERNEYITHSTNMWKQMLKTLHTNSQLTA